MALAHAYMRAAKAASSPQTTETKALRPELEEVSLLQRVNDRRRASDPRAVPGLRDEDEESDSEMDGTPTMTARGLAAEADVPPAAWEMLPWGF